MENFENINYLIVPDVHGRTFWKNTVMECLDKTKCKVIFLGDYTDPYGYEGISREKCIDVFRDIIEIKKKYNDRVTLLVGNHDFSYIAETGSGGRYDEWNAEKIRDMFLSNWDMFEFFHKDEIGGKVFLFSHAGINQDWLVYRKDFFGLNVDEDTNAVKGDVVEFVLNYDWKHNLFKSDKKELVSYLEDVSFWRWGNDAASSFIWCDVREHLYEHNPIKNVVQVFGHTQQEKDPVRFGDSLYCLDVRRCFFIDESGNVLNMDGSELEDNGDKYMRN